MKMTREEPEDPWERYKRKMDNWPSGFIGEAVGKTFIFLLWIAFMAFLAEINVHPILGGLVLLGGIVVIVKDLVGFDY